MDSVLITKLISAAIYPLGLFIVLICIAALFRWLKRRFVAGLCFLLAWSILLAASNPKLASFLVQSLEQQHPQQSLEEIAKHDAILVLGGGLGLPLEPSKFVQLTSGSDRYWHAARLIKAEKAPVVLLSGGNVFEQPGFEGESFYAAELMQQWGIAPDVIKIETASRNTTQNIANISNWLQTNQVKSVLLVTSAYHMPRAIEEMRALNLKVTPASADVIVRDYKRPVWLEWIPSAHALGLTTLALHEYYGLAFSKLKKRISRF